MKTTLLTILCLSLLAPQGRGACLRIMPPAELVANSILIARARVLAVEESDWGMYRQTAELELTDIVYGDITLKRARVGAASGVACAGDRYAKKEEWLVFLALDGGLYHTANYQFGQFRVDGDVVRGWRNAEGVAADKPYYSVREDVEAIIAGIHTPPPEGATEQVVTPMPPAPAPAPPPQSQAPNQARPGVKIAKPVRRQRLTPQP